LSVAIAGLGRSSATSSSERRNKAIAPYALADLALPRYNFVMEPGATKLPRPPITGKAKGERPQIPHLA
jgi:hypothetical protein